jgi:hypothetical protein
MPIMAGILSREDQHLLKGFLDFPEDDEFSFLTEAGLLMSVKTLKKLPCRLAGLGTQDEPSQQQDSNLCPNCCLISLLGPAARAPPVGNGKQSNAKRE